VIHICKYASILHASKMSLVMIGVRTHTSVRRYMHINKCKDTGTDTRHEKQIHMQQHASTHIHRRIRSQTQNM